MDAMPPIDYRETCVIQASAYYQAPPDLVRAVIRTEGGKTGKVNRNSDGSFDMGLMQINSIHLPELAKYGINQEMLINNECVNIFIGTFYLQKNILSGKDFWHGVGKYHSKTPSKNTIYQYKVWNNLQQVQRVSR